MSGRISGRWRFGTAILLAGLAISAAGRQSRAADFDFVVIGDTRPTFESSNFRNFEALIPRINELRPALIINLGDLIYGYGVWRKEKQWDKYEEAIKAIQAPYFQLPGNHDTFSKEARRIYGRRFGTFYRSFDHGDCHFVLLDNTENQKWGHMGAAQLKWLEKDLGENQSRQVFVFMHFPVWEPERVPPQAYDQWARTLHPLFLSNRVSAVFGGHYHSYGPTREFDGIRYYITGGGGAELRPEYRRSGGEFHFVRVRVSSGAYDLRVVTQNGELTDTQADVMGGLLAADRHSSRIGIRQDSGNLKEGVDFSLVLNNPQKNPLTGKGDWLFDASAFVLEPKSFPIEIAAGGSRRYEFRVRALKDAALLQSLPRLEFDLREGTRHLRFRRELRFLQAVPTPYRQKPPSVDGDLGDWTDLRIQALRETSRSDASFRACYDRENLYLGVNLPTVKPGEEEEAENDDLQLGLAHRLKDNAFSSDFLRLGFGNSGGEARNRTPGRKKAGVVPGIRCAARQNGDRTVFEISIPLRLLRPLRGSAESLVADVAFRVPDAGPEAMEAAEPAPNSFSYQVRYGADILLPVHFLELRFEGGPLGKRQKSENQ